MTAGLAAGAVCAFSVLSVHASLRDDDTRKIVRDPSFYFGVTGDYGRMELKDGGLSLMKPGFPNKGIIDKDVASGSLLFGINNLIDLDGTVSLRGEIEYQKIGTQKPYGLNTTAKPLSVYYLRDIETHSGFANLWIDLKLADFENTKFFFGGGIGFASHGVQTYAPYATGGGRNLQFAYHVGAGISHALNDQVDFVIGGRYNDLGISRIDTGSGGSLKLKHSGFEARIGLRYKLETLKFGK